MNSIVIDRIEKGNSQRYNVFSDDKFLFSLYNHEIKQYGLKAQSEIAHSVYIDILENVVKKRAKERALYLLERRPYSEYMLRKKLILNAYPNDIIDEVVEFLKQYRYLDDYMYIQMYVNQSVSKKSKKQFVFDLKRKGISKELLEQYFDEYPYCEEQRLSEQMERYVKNMDLQDWKVQQRVIRYFLGKGFSYPHIRECVQRMLSVE